MKRNCVVNTRAIRQQAVLTDLCQKRGWNVLEYPCIGVDLTNIVELRSHLLIRGDSYAWLVLTSGNAVDAVAAAVNDIDIQLPPLACVGSATAKHASDLFGKRVAFLPTEATGACLATELTIQAGDRVLLPQSAIANAETMEILQARGAVVDAISAYTVHTGNGGDDVPAAIVSGQVDAVIITSPSALDGFMSRLGAAGVDRSALDNLIFAPIGPTSALAISKKCLQGLPVPTEHSLEGLLDVLACYFDRLETPNETVQT